MLIRTLAAVIVAAAVAAAATAATPSVEDFVRRHWRAPLAPQGSAPARFSSIEASLAPEACGTCHPAQLADWRTSLHSRTTGPGIAGQLAEMLASEPADALSCYICHAPLAEQRPLVRTDTGHAPNPAFDASLSAQGLVCAACHVRGHERFGPPRRDGTVANSGPRESVPHGGATRTSAFLASEFCRGCHQFEPDGLSLNGKLVEDTYAEWRASRFARDGVQCQDCHMPDRRHLWRGIHDAEMVRSGVTVTVAPLALRDGVVTSSIELRSTRVGHAFPTYVVPRVLLRGEQLDAAGAVVAGTARERVIAREVTLDLARELRDTRLRPGESATLAYRLARAAGARALRLSVVVEPDAFYTRFFATLLQQGAGRGEAALRTALDTAGRSPYVLFTRELALD